MRVLVCGSRTFDDSHLLNCVLDGLHADLADWHGSMTVVQGGARGADRLAKTWANLTGSVGQEEFPADWDGLGKRAGYVRNVEMLDSGVDLVIAFLDREMTKGTGHTVTEAKRRGLPVWEITSNKRALHAD